MTRRARFYADKTLLALCPPLWRKIFGRRRGVGNSFEDFCENIAKGTPNPKDVLGRDGERLAFEYFHRNPNIQILGCGVETYFCELDLIFIDKTTRELVFVEVKTRK
ncbi:MAG: YraN family protein, partial [Thermoguttaceae bacterium]|nr:YraN family protein [Thermoguttaceae bacterium]